MKNVIFILCTFLSLFFPKLGTAQRRPFSAISVPPKVVCYMSSWSRYRSSPMSYLPENIPAKDCDVLVYVYLTINASNWKLESRDREADYVKGGFRDIAALKSISPDIKLVLAVGGYDESQGIKPVKLYSDMMASPVSRMAFVKSARSFLVSKGFHGLELHWYYPGANDKNNYVQLIKELHREFSRYNLDLYARVPYYSGAIEKGFNVTEISRYLTALHVSTVDMIVYSGKQTADNSSPLHRRSFDAPGSEQYYQNVEYVLDLYTSLGVPKEKLIFGVSTSGHSFDLQDVSVHGLDSPIKGRDTKTGRYSQEAGIFFYYEICAKIQSGKWLSRRDPESGIPYAYNPSTGQWVSYDDQDTITAKAQFAKSSGYGGIFLWMLDEDDFRGLCGEKHGLLRTLVRELKGPDHEGVTKRRKQVTLTSEEDTTLVDATKEAGEEEAEEEEKEENFNESFRDPLQSAIERARATFMLYGNRTGYPFRGIGEIYSRPNFNWSSIF